MKKGDRFMVGLFVVAGLASIGYYFFTQRPVSAVEIIQENQVVATLPLNEDTTYTLDSDGKHNVIQIKDGQATMLEANCHDGLCLHQSPVKGSGQTITCLPNGVMIRGSGDAGNDSGLDGVSQ